MKFFVLAFAIFSASQAYVLRDEPYPHLAKLNQELLEYMQNITRIVDEKMDYIQNLKLSQAMLDRLQHTYLKISEHLNYLESKLPPDVLGTYYTALAMSMGLVEKGIDAVNNFKRQLTPVTDKVAESLYSIVAPFANSVLKYSEVLRRAVSTSVEKLNPRLSEKLKKLLEKLTKELAPLVQTLQNELQELKASLQPATDHIQKKMKESLERINQDLQPYLAPILETLEKYTKASPVEP